MILSMGSNKMTGCMEGRGGAKGNACQWQRKEELQGLYADNIRQQRNQRQTQD
jgi:hypothetical protein